MKRIFTFTVLLTLLLSSITSSASGSSPLKGYEWLEGTWLMEKDYSWAKVYIDKSTYKFVCSYYNGDIAEIDLMKKIPILISKATSRETNEEILVLDGDNPFPDIGIDENKRQIFLNHELGREYLSKIDGPYLPLKWNEPSSYEWLEGTWASQNRYEWGEVIIDKSTYRVVSSNWNEDVSEIETQEAQPISIDYVSNYITGQSMIALDSTNYCIGIAPSTQEVYLILGEYTGLRLEKIPSGTHLKRYYSVDVIDMDNSTPFNIVKFKKSAFFRSDYWFSEVAGMTTDGEWWGSGTLKSDGYYTYHRFNSLQYTCSFVDHRYVKGDDGYGGNVAYGIALRDVFRSTLPEENGYYVLDLRDWEGYVPLYFPYSYSYIYENFNPGDIIFEYQE
jgi:hypothetical protein